MRVPILLVVMCFLIGCSQGGLNAGGTSPLSEDLGVAKHQLEQLVPRGTPQGDAAKTLSKVGFSVKLMHGSFGNESFPEFIYCHFNNGGEPVSRSWMVAVVLKDARVIDYRVESGLIGP
jgi:hypothetical protein